MRKHLLSALIMITAAVNTYAQDSTQQQVIGTYKFPEGSVVPEVIVTFEGGGLKINSTAGTSSLELIKGDTFNIVSFNGTAVFKRNEAQKVVGVHIDASGYVLDGVKEGADKYAILSIGNIGLNNKDGQNQPQQLPYHKTFSTALVNRNGAR